MKQLLDYIPLIVFFVVYKMEERVISLGGFEYTLGGIFSATEILIAASVLVYGGLYLKNRKLERAQVITLVAVLIFCSFTILFRDEAILKWKAPVVNWIFAAIFFATHWLMPKPAYQMMLEHAVSLPAPLWRRLNLAWGCFFLFLGAANLFVAFTFHEYWVDFKVFGSLALILLFVVAQTFYMAPYLSQEEAEADGAPPRE